LVCPPRTVRAMDLRYLERWAKGRKKPVFRQMGVDAIHLGKKQKFLTVVSNLETGEPLWFGAARKEGTPDEFFGSQSSSFQRCRIAAPPTKKAAVAGLGSTTLQDTI
jgi:hypothetical protein